MYLNVLSCWCFTLWHTQHSHSTLTFSKLTELKKKHTYTHIELGVRIFELTKQSLHAKIITVDGVYCSVGSYNLDYLSTYRNLEVTLSALDRSLVNQLDQQFVNDFKSAKEVMLTTLSQRAWYERLIHATAYQVARFFKFLNF